MSPLVEPQHSVILVVGREQFTPPKTFGGEACTATHDCVAIGVRTVEDGPTDVTISPEAGTGALVRLGEFQVETEGLLWCAASTTRSTTQWESRRASRA